jgi:hypothetical protein
MKHKLITTGDKEQNVKVTLSMMELKMMYNLCIDTVEEYPSMIGYKTLANKLKLAIDSEPIMLALDALFSED